MLSYKAKIMFVCFFFIKNAFRKNFFIMILLILLYY